MYVLIKKSQEILQNESIWFGKNYYYAIWSLFH